MGAGTVLRLAPGSNRFKRMNWATPSFLGKKKPLSKPQKFAVKRLIKRNIETKYFDTTDVSDISSTATIARLDNIIEGLDYNDRVGRELIPSSIDINHWTKINSAGTYCTVRLIVFQDTSAETTLPTHGQILQGTSYITGLPEKDTQRNRVKILLDRAWSFSANGTYSSMQRFHISGKRLAKVHFDGVSSAVSGKGKLGYMLFSNTSANNVNQVFQARLAYKDT